MKGTASTKTLGCKMEGGQDPTTEILAKIEAPAWQCGGQGGDRAKVGDAAVLEAAGSGAAKCRRLVCRVTRAFPWRTEVHQS
jgi:hypothetical protein